MLSLKIVLIGSSAIEESLTLKLGNKINYCVYIYPQMIEDIEKCPTHEDTHNVFEPNNLVHDYFLVGSLIFRLPSVRSCVGLVGSAVKLLLEGF